MTRHGEKDFLPGGTLLATLGTDAVELYLMGLHLESEMLGDFLLQSFYRLVLELLDGATPGADQVVMVLSFGKVFVPGLTVTEVDFPGNARFSEKLQ